MERIGKRMPKFRVARNSRKWFHEGLDFVICVHKPHPSNIVKEYVIKQIVNAFEDRGII